MSSSPHPALIAVAHGSRSAAAQASVRELLAAVRAARPRLDVREAYIELAAPSLPQALAAAPPGVVLVPLLLGNGYHIAHDVAGVAAAYSRGPDGAGPTVGPALGPHPLLAEALADRLAEAEALADRHAEAETGVGLSGGARREGPVVLAAAGSSDPRSHADTEAMARLLAARLGRLVVTAFNGAAVPRVDEAVAGLRREGHRHVSVATYLLSPGRFADEVAACGADAVSAPLGAHPALVRLVLERYDGPLATALARAPAAARSA